MLSETPSSCTLSLSSSTNSLSLDAQSSNEISLQIDFSQFPEDVCNGTEEEVRNIGKQLDEQLEKIQNEFERIAKPNFKVHDFCTFYTRDTYI